MIGTSEKDAARHVSEKEHTVTVRSGVEEQWSPMEPSELFLANCDRLVEFLKENGPATSREAANVLGNRYSDIVAYRDWLEAQETIRIFTQHSGGVGQPKILMALCGA